MFYSHYNGKCIQAIIFIVCIYYIKLRGGAFIVIHLCSSQLFKNCLNYAMLQGTIPQGEILFLQDDLSFGRIDHEYTMRYKYLKILTNNDEEYLNFNFSNNMQLIQRLKNMRDCECIIWYSNRSYEYCFMMFCINYLPSKRVQVYEVNISQGLEDDSNLLCTTDLNPEDIAKYKDKIILIPFKAKTEIIHSWYKFIIENSLLRVFYKNTVISRNPDYYDSNILDSIIHCKNSHDSISSHFFRKHDGIVTDGFFNWRLRALVENKTLTFKNGNYEV